MGERPSHPDGEPSNAVPDKKKTNIDFFRHSVSSYATYRDLNAGPTPEKAFNPDEQILPDLTPEGAELAHARAEAFFSGMNPTESKLFFVSSNEARTLETANMFRKTAKEHGFTVLAPEHARSVVSEQVADGEIRVIDALSLNLKNTLPMNLFNSRTSRRPVNFEALDGEKRALYERLEAEIDADDKGSFAANYLAYGERVKEFFPEIQTAEELYNTQFKNLLRLARFAHGKVGSSEESAKIKILAFGHENQLLIALNRYFQEKGIGNCEVLQLEVDDTSVEGSFRDKQASL